MSKSLKPTDDIQQPKSTDSSALDVVEAAKAKQSSLRERLAARRQKTQNLLASIGTSGTKPLVPPTRLSSNVSASAIKTSLSFQQPQTLLHANVLKKKCPDSRSPASEQVKEFQTTDSTPATSNDKAEKPILSASEITEHRESTSSHTDSSDPNQTITEPPISDHTPSVSSRSTSDLKKSESDPVKPTKIPKLDPSHSCLSSHKSEPTAPKISTSSQPDPGETTSNQSKSNDPKFVGRQTPTNSDSQNSKFELENLLGAQTAREKENKRVREEIMELLNRPTTKERSLNAKFRSQGGSQVKQFCSYGTRIECSKHKARSGNRERCTKLHFRKIIHPHTDESLGDCSFLNTCFHVDTCKYVHYTIDYSDHIPSTNANRNRSQTHGDDQQSMEGNRSTLNRLGANGGHDEANGTDAANKCSTSVMGSGDGGSCGNGNSNVMDSTQSDKENGTSLNLYPPQWINCDIRQINMSILGKFSVIMADPPWDIHMELPYGTMSDDEMRRLDIPCLQDDGYLFLWVTGRAMELGRECLRLWGYQRVDEIIWVKTNQLQRLIRTGRTGHWLNHGKEHCLVGVKGNPQSVNRGLDCDIIVSEVRETSHKPDEIYGIIERLSPGTRKLELFGRPHNLQPNWITLGNQLDGTYLVDPAVVERFKKQYPNGIETKAK